MNRSKVTEKMIEFEEMRAKLEENGLLVVVPPLLLPGDVSIVDSLNGLMSCLTATEPVDWAATRVNASFTALDFASILGVSAGAFHCLGVCKLGQQGPQACRNQRVVRDGNVSCRADARKVGLDRCGVLQCQSWHLAHTITNTRTRGP